MAVAAVEVAQLVEILQKTNFPNSQQKDDQEVGHLMQQQETQQLVQKLLVNLETQSDLIIDFTSLKACLNPMGLGGTEDNMQADQLQDFDYNSFVCELFENQPKTLPHLQKLTVRRILEQKYPTALSLDQFDHYNRLNYGMMQLSCLLELDLSDIPDFFHDNLQLWNLSNLTKLSVTHSKLKTFPGSVGRLRQLETLDLSHNALSSLPITLSFCQNLNTLDIRRNNFKHLPGTVMRIKSLTTLKRLDNPLRPMYACPGPRFTSKINQTANADKKKVYQPMSLQETCTTVVFTSKLDYWETDRIGVLQCKTLDKLAEKFCACDNCNRMLLNDEASRLEVEVLLVTFKELTGVPFILRACNVQCQQILFDRYGTQNILLQQEIDSKYETLVKQANKDVQEGRVEMLPATTYTPVCRPSISSQRNRRRKGCSIM